MGFLLVHFKNTDRWITNTDMNKHGGKTSQYQVLRMKQSKLTTTGLDAKQGMFFFFFVFSFLSLTVYSNNAAHQNHLSVTYHGDLHGKDVW